MVVVTGASRGIGRFICERLYFKGMPVMGLSRNTKELPFPAISCDVSSYEEVKSVVRIIQSKGLKVTSLINVAGIASMNLALTTPSEVTEKIIQTNLLGTIYCSQLFAPFLIRNGGGERHKFFNHSSFSWPKR